MSSSTLDVEFPASRCRVLFSIFPTARWLAPVHVWPGKKLTPHVVISSCIQGEETQSGHSHGWALELVHTSVIVLSKIT